MAMFVLDTNHVTEFAYSSAAGLRLRNRMRQSESEYATTGITVEEDLRGWLARLQQLRHEEEQIAIYQKLASRIEFFSRWVTLQIDSESLAQFRTFRKQGIRIGTQDLKIACIAMAHDATVLTRNLVDFQQVPGLRVENWLD